MCLEYGFAPILQAQSGQATVTKWKNTIVLLYDSTTIFQFILIYDTNLEKYETKIVFFWWHKKKQFQKLINTLQHLKNPSTIILQNHYLTQKKQKKTTLQTKQCLEVCFDESSSTWSDFIFSSSCLPESPLSCFVAFTTFGFCEAGIADVVTVVIGSSWISGSKLNVDGVPSVCSVVVVVVVVVVWTILAEKDEKNCFFFWRFGGVFFSPEALLFLWLVNHVSTCLNYCGITLEASKAEQQQRISPPKHFLKKSSLILVDNQFNCLSFDGKVLILSIEQQNLHLFQMEHPTNWQQRLLVWKNPGTTNRRLLELWNSKLLIYWEFLEKLLQWQRKLHQLFYLEMTDSNLQYINSGHQLAVNAHSNHLLLHNTHFSEKLKKFKDYVFQMKRCAWKTEIWNIALKSCPSYQKNINNQWLLWSKKYWRILFWWQEIIKNFSAALGTENKFVNSDNNTQQFAENP